MTTIIRYFIGIVFFLSVMPGIGISQDSGVVSGEHKTADTSKHIIKKSWHKVKHTVSSGYYSAAKTTGKAWNATKQTVKEGYRTTANATGKAWNATKQAVDTGYHRASNATVKAWHATKHGVTKGYHKIVAPPKKPETLPDTMK